MNPKAYRLPTHVLPRRYDIELDARQGSSTFTGSVAIQLEVTEPTETIELHARDLQVETATLTRDGQTTQAPVTLDADRELAIVQLSEPLPAGTATLTLPFTANVSSGLEGLFLSKDGPEELLVTQCEATGARAIFPCFDEPLFKACFAWRVTTAAGATVLNNGRLVSDEPSADGTSHTCTFEPTPPMSTYLVALAIGDLAGTPERVVNGVPLGIWGIRGKEGLGGFALDYTARLLPFYEDYFAVPYHFGKLDQVGVPSFGAGAMENAGLIVSQGVLLLLDEQQASVHQKLYAAMVIAHEFAHMWFGDLVTMRWWDDLWLNEAFASWMASHAVDTLTPEYRIWDELQPGADRALEVDGLASTHPIYNPVDSPASINENFDIITYQKGGAVLRMLHDFLGDEAFRAGLRTYMREFAESNATGADLWRHLQAASNLPIGQVMETWILQPGHPIVEVSLETGVGGPRLHLSQRRFFASADAPASDQLWQVPMVIRYEDAAGVHEVRHLLGERSATLPLAVAGDLLWCYPNAGEVGFYRSQLDPMLAQRVGAHLDRLTVAEQKGLLRDSWAAVANASQPIAGYLDMVAALASSDDHTLMGQIVNDHLPRIWSLLYAAGDESALASFRGWVARLLAGRLAALGYEPRPGENADVALLRAAVIAAMTRYAEDPGAIAQAREWQAREAADPESVDPNLAAVFVGATAQFGDASTYDKYLSIYEARKSGTFTPQQLERYADAFARFNQPELVARTLQMMDEGAFSLQMIAQLVAQFMFQPRTCQAGWEYIKAHWDEIMQMAPFFAPPLVQSSGVLPASLRADVAAFWEAKLHGELAGPVARALEQIDQTAELQTRTHESLLAYYAKSAPATPSAPAAPEAPAPATPPAPPAPAEPPSASAAPAEPAVPLAPVPPVPPVPPVAPVAPVEPAAPDAPAQAAVSPTNPVPAVPDPTRAPGSDAPAAPPAPAPTPAPRSDERRGWFRRLFGG